jgi:hypothetical protein
MDRLHECFGDLPDPRAENAQHDLTELLFIALLASLCGATGRSDIEEFWAGQRAAAAYDSDARAWDAEPRHVQPGVTPSRSNRRSGGSSGRSGGGR